MNLVFVRHAEPFYADDSLTEKGFREAELLADRLVNFPNIEAIYSSPCGRAKDTAAPTLRRLKRSSEILPWLHEFEGMITDPQSCRKRIPWDLKPQWWMGDPVLKDETAWTSHPLMQTGNVAEIYDRTCRGLDEVLARHGYYRDGDLYRCDNNREGTIFLFCHMAVAMAAIGHLTGISPMLLWHGFCMPPSGVTTFISEERERGTVSFRCFQLGDTSHLYADGEVPSRMAMFQEVFHGTDNTGTR